MKSQQISTIGRYLPNIAVSFNLYSLRKTLLEVQSVYGIWDRGEAVPATAAADTKALRLVEQVVTNEVVETGGEFVTRRTVSENPVAYEPAGARTWT